MNLSHELNIDLGKVYECGKEIERNNEWYRERVRLTLKWLTTKKEEKKTRINSKTIHIINEINWKSRFGNICWIFLNGKSRIVFFSCIAWKVIVVFQSWWTAVHSSDESTPPLVLSVCTILKLFTNYLINLIYG